MVIINKQINVLVSFQSLSVPSSLAREAVPSLQTLYLFVVALPLGVFNKNKNKDFSRVYADFLTCTGTKRIKSLL